MRYQALRRLIQIGRLVHVWLLVATAVMHLWPATADSGHEPAGQHLGIREGLTTSQVAGQPAAVTRPEGLRAQYALGCPMQFLA